MRIAFLLDGFPAVSETFIINQLTGLLDKGVEITIYAAKNPGHKVHERYYRYNLSEKTIYEVPWTGSRMKNFSTTVSIFFRLLYKSPALLAKLFFFQGKFFHFHYMRAVFAASDHPPFDIVHAHFGPLGVKMVKLQQLHLLKAPVVCSFHGYDVDRNDFRNNPGYYGELFAASSRITANSQYTANNIAALGCPAEKIEILPESLYTDFFTRKEKKNNNSGTKIVSVARLVEFKGIDYAIRAIHTLVNKGYTNIQYQVIGDGPLRNELETLTASLGLEQYVHFYGPLIQEEILILLDNADIFLLAGITSKDGRQENQGLVIQEAQAMELPVVVSNIGGVPEGIIDGETGFLVEEKDTISIAAKLELLINAPELRKQMGEKGRAFVQSKFDTAVLSDKLLAIYSTIIQEKTNN